MKTIFLFARMRLTNSLRLATTDLRDQFVRWSLLLCIMQPLPLKAASVLSILTQTQRLDAGLVQEFEASRKVSVRVEFVSSSLDYESKIRSLPNNWDLVLADEQRLVNLSLSKVIKSIPESVPVPREDAGLERRARANPDGRSYLNLMADPLGIMYLKKTLTAPGILNWEWVVNPSFNPLWRSRLALFADERMTLMTAAVASGIQFPLEEVQNARKVQDWLSQAHLQGRSLTLSALIPAFLAEKYAVALAWQSDYLHASRYVKDLAFAVPVEGTYVERFGVGLIADGRNESLALEFIRFLYEKKEILAQRRGFKSLADQGSKDGAVSQWRIFSDDLPHLKELSSALTKVKKEKDGRKSSSQR